jgi:hypothetical protein
MGFAAFMAGWFGRAIRIAAGLALIGIGLFRVNGTRGIAIAVVGLVPLLAGAFNVCVLAPLLHVPFEGAEVRTPTSASPAAGDCR